MNRPLKFFRLLIGVMVLGLLFSFMIFLPESGRKDIRSQTLLVVDTTASSPKVPEVTTRLVEMKTTPTLRELCPLTSPYLSKYHSIYIYIYI